MSAGHSFVSLKMPSLLPGFSYDIFISYRQKDNRGDKWVTEFVGALKRELDATLKEDISIYFDENPSDGVLESHQVDKSLEGKLRCLIFIPVISQTYCDPRSFAWKDELCAFNTQTQKDSLGRDIRLASGNVASRILPVRIHDLDAKDRALFETELGTPLRSIDFIFKAPGVNRPLTPQDKKEENHNKTFYKDQVNKVANAIKELLLAMVEPTIIPESTEKHSVSPEVVETSIVTKIFTRGLPRVALVYAVFALLLLQFYQTLLTRLHLPGWANSAMLMLLVAGFPLALFLAWRYEFSPGGIIRTGSASAADNPFSPSRKKPLTGNLVLIILLGALAVQYILSSQPPAATQPSNSIAVLYFDNISNDPEQEVFSDGITEEITAHLSSIRSLRVTSRTSVIPYKGKTKAMNIRQMAEELGVDHILEGSVRKSGNKLRITAQLIEARTDKHLWTEVYDREVTDIFAIQSEIAKAIARKFNVMISPEANARLEEVPTRNMQAYELYLKARALPDVSGFGIGTYYGTVRKGIAMLKQAIALDPEFADAYVLQSSMYLQLESSYDSAVLLAKEGVLNNPKSAGAYIMLGQLTEEIKWLKKAYELDTVAGLMTFSRILREGAKPHYAVRCQQEARRRAPNSITPLLHLASTYWRIGVPDSMNYYLALARQLDPKSRDLMEQESFSLRFSMDPEKWKLLARDFYGEDTMSYYKDVGIAYLYARKWKEAEAAYAKTEYRDMDLGLVMLKTGREDSGRSIMRRSLEYQLSHYGWNGNIARMYAVLGQRKKAIEYYRKVFNSSAQIAFFEVDPFTDYIRDDPDFKAVFDGCKQRIAGELELIRQQGNKPLSLQEILDEINSVPKANPQKD